MGGDSQATMCVTHIAEATGGGVWRHLRWIVPELCSRGVQVDLILSPTRSEPDFFETLTYFRKLRCRLDVWPMKHGVAPLRDRAAVRRIRQRLVEWQPHILHAHATKGGLVGRLAAAAVPNVRTVYSPHAFCFEGYPRGVRRQLGVRMERWLLNHTDRILLVSAAERQTATKIARIPEQMIQVVENGIPDGFGEQLLDRESARSAWHIPDDVVAIGVPGRLSPQKGHDWLLKAVAELHPQERRIHVYICGGGPSEQRLREQCMKLGIGSFITWMGHVPELAFGLRAFDIVVLPSRYEGLSYLLLETLAAGVPLIVSNIPANLPREHMRDHIPAVPVGDAPALAQAILELIRNPARRAQVGDWAPAFVRANFSLDRQVDGLLTCYQELLSGTGTPTAEPPR